MRYASSSGNERKKSSTAPPDKTLPGLVEAGEEATHQPMLRRGRGCPFHVRRVTNTGETARPCGSFSGTATCSAAPARTSTRGRSRASGAVPATTSSSCHRRRTRSSMTSAARRRCGPTSAGSCPRSSSTGTRGYEAKLLQDTSQEERDRFVESNASVLRELAPADLVFANHVLLGAPVGAASGLPFAVKAHGSELEYSMRGNEELGRWGRETLADARAVFVGSAHIREVLEDVVGHVDRVYEVPPGVDVDEFHPERAETRSPTWSRKRGATHRTRAARTSGSPTRATPRGSRSSSPGRRRRSSTSAS